MPYRDFTLPDGRVERVRISDEAVMEWWEQREHGKGAGYLDRPPDVDTEASRVWMPRPGEKGYAEHLLQGARRKDVNMRDHGDFVVFTLTSTLPTAVQTLVADWRDGQYVVRVLIKEIRYGALLLAHKSEYDTEDAAQAAIDDALDRFREVEVGLEAVLGDAWESVSWISASYVDFEALETELELAREESHAEFGKLDLPEPVFEH